MRKMKKSKDVFQIYMRQIRNIPVLSKTEEGVYANRVTEGDQRAKEKLIVSNLKFVVRIAVRYKKLGIPLMID
ncbi:MAG: hypothetical protein AMS17_04270 [Spirochaetes bacterium DG_61]|jgi:RNA polymerase primary sigma factor|nr:MAG: hypothetical protein AMS17_04270 [Spirochaetes bacterium DG_61]